MRSRDIDQAVSMTGEPYGDHPNAYLYRKRFNPACFCRRPGETHGERNARVLNPDDAGINGFEPMNLDAEPLEDVPLRGFEARPGAKRDTSVFGKRPPPEPPAPPHPNIESPAERMVAADQGEVREFKGRDGATRSVRIIAPELSRAPAAAAAPSVPDRAPAP